MAKIIFNADDYGFCDQVDNGVIKAINQGLINSVAAFGNGHNGVERLKKLAPLQEKADIGCHISITSGTPITPMELFTRELNGKQYFRTFTQLKRPNPKDTAAIAQAKKELKIEINAQIDVLVDAGIDVKHLSSHHNSLIFFPEYFEAQIEVARERNIKLRSTTIVPKLKNNLYLTQLAARSVDNLGIKNFAELIKFTSNIEAWMGKYPSTIPAMPDAIDGSHYGPLGLDNIKTKNEFERKRKKKAEDLHKNIRSLKPGDVIEYCFHLSDPNGLNHYTFIDEKNPDYYPGVDWKYFDSRKLEFASLELTKELGQTPPLSRWKDVQ